MLEQEWAVSVSVELADMIPVLIANAIENYRIRAVVSGCNAALLFDGVDSMLELGVKPTDICSSGTFPGRLLSNEFVEAVGINSSSSAIVSWFISSAKEKNSNSELISGNNLFDKFSL